MSNEQKPVTAGDEYKNRLKNEKIVELPSGATFKIRRLTGRDYIDAMIDLPLQSASDLTRTTAEERKKALWDNMSPENRKKYVAEIGKMLVIAVIEPPLTVTDEPGKLSVRDLTDEDFYALLNNVMELTNSGGAGNKFFRTEQNANTN